MKKIVSVASTVQANLLLCCSAAVLLSACGGGSADSGQPAQQAATSNDSVAAVSGQSAGVANSSNVAAPIPSSTESASGATVAPPDNSTVATTAPSATQAAPAATPGDSTRLLAESAAPAAAANHLYVATTGSDSNPGTLAAPFKTIAKADSRAGAGYVIHVAPGVYNVSAPSLGNAGIITSKSGTSAARIKYVSDVKWGAKIVVSGTGITWDSRGSYVDIEGFDISGSGRHGILASGAYLSMRNNFIHDLTISGGCNGSGGAAIDTYGPVGNVVIDSNVVRNIGASMIGRCNTVQGIYIANPNNLVTNNIVSGVAMAGIQQWHGATASTIVNNTTFHNKDGILLGQGDAGTTATGSENNYVANNLVYDNAAYGIIELGKMGGNNRYANNLVASSGSNWRVAGSVSGSVSANPQFANYRADGTGDYHVLSGSPAIDKGTSAQAPASDFAGVARTRGAAVDIGAYEF